MKFLKNIGISPAVLLIIVTMNKFQLRFFIWIFFFDSGVKPHTKIVFYYFYYCINVRLKLLTYFVKTGFNKVLRSHFFAINFFQINWFLGILVNFTS